MKKFAVLVLLLLPVCALAEDMYKWHDAQGRLHYTNDPTKAPADATIVTKQLGYSDGNVPYQDPAEVQSDLQYYRKLHEKRLRPEEPTAPSGGVGPTVFGGVPVVPGAGYQPFGWGYPAGYLSFAGYANNPFGGYIPFPHVRPGRTPPVGAWLWTAGYELAWRELGVRF
jgi:hypothetical protein